MPAVSIADHASATECESSDEVAQLAVAVAHVVAQQPLGLEAEAAEHRHRALLLGDDLDD